MVFIIVEYFFFDKKIENKNLKYNESNLKINKKNLEIKELKIGDFVKIKGNGDNIYIIFNYDIPSAKYVLFDLSSTYNEEELQKKNKFSMLPFITYRNKNQLNISNELPVQPIPKYVQNFISEHNNSLPFLMQEIILVTITIAIYLFLMQKINFNN